jgi:hypothetical protein
MEERFDVDVSGDRVEALLTELFTEHWKRLTVGPLVEGAAYEIRFTAPPRVSMLDGYMTVDLGNWHFHLCVNDHTHASSPEQARIRRVARAAFVRMTGGTCSPESLGLQLWNGRGEQMITVLFPNPYFDDESRRLREPRPENAALWEDFRRRFATA